jgi:hypothetical protein
MASTRYLKKIHSPSSGKIVPGHCTPFYTSFFSLSWLYKKNSKCGRKLFADLSPRVNKTQEQAANLEVGSLHL